jgi:hypothetical protein
MTTTSRRISERLHHNRASHTPGNTKGGFCVRPKDAGLAISGNPYKGAGLKGRHLNTYNRLWTRYKGAKGNV